MTTQTIIDAKATAAEWYEFPGNAAENKPPYRVVRHGNTVMSQIEHQDAEIIECSSLEEARAEFAEQTVDPDGPAAPQPGDHIRIVWGDLRTDSAEAGETFTVDSVIRHDHGDWTSFSVSVDTKNRPLEMLFGQYKIVARPAA